MRIMSDSAQFTEWRSFDHELDHIVFGWGTEPRLLWTDGNLDVFYREKRWYDRTHRRYNRHLNKGNTMSKHFYYATYRPNNTMCKELLSVNLVVSDEQTRITQAEMLVLKKALIVAIQKYWSITVTKH